MLLILIKLSVKFKEFSCQFCISVQKIFDMFKLEAFFCVSR